MSGCQHRDNYENTRKKWIKKNQEMLAESWKEYMWLADNHNGCNSEKNRDLIGHSDRSVELTGRDLVTSVNRSSKGDDESVLAILNSSPRFTHRA